MLAVTAGLALLYACALIVGTPPNSHDALTYHLARAAFWRQDGGVGYVTNAYDERLNVNPPNAEIVLTFLLEVGRNERFVGFVQFSAALVLTLGVYALARAVNLSRREAAVGALLFLTLPIVLLQSSTPQNDLVAASFLLSATVFLVHGGRVGLVLAGLATALAIGTKIPTAYGLPILVTLALVIPPRTAWKGRIASISIGAALGSYWYVVNVVRTGRPLGDLPEEAPGLVAILDPVHNFFSAFARFIDAFDLSGAWGPNVLIYAIVAVGVVFLLLVRSRDKRDSKPTQALVTGALIIIPLMVIPVSYVLRIVFEALGGPDAFDDRFLPLLGWGKTVASDTVSWFGAIGLLFVVGMAIMVPIMVRRGALPSYAAALVAAPLLWFGLFAVTLGYDITQGRFFIFPVALSASLWGLVLRVDRYAVATVAIASTTASLTLVNFLEKPSGIRLLEADASATVWGVQRWKAQSIPEPDTRAALRFLDGIPTAATVALALEFNDFGYPAFGPSLERHVELVPDGSAAT